MTNKEKKKGLNILINECDLTDWYKELLQEVLKDLETLDQLKEILSMVLKWLKDYKHI